MGGGLTKTSIEWTERVWNPFAGCSVLSPGCTNCYAMKMARRIEACNAGLRQGHGGSPHYAGTTKIVNGNAVWTGKIGIASDEVLLAPLRRKRPTTYFVNSMSDLFHESVPDEWIDKVFAVMALTPQHTYQVLTNRSARMRNYVIHLYETDEGIERLSDAAVAVSGAPCAAHIEDVTPPLPNVWLGVSTERQKEADERIPDLLATPAAMRFISAEPLLGPIELTRIGTMHSIRAAMPEVIEREERGKPKTGNGSICGAQIDAVGSSGSSITFFQTPDHMGGFTAASPRQWPRLDCVIVGGESGPGARPMHPDWARSIRDQCAAAGVPFFFKQWGAWAPVPHRDDLPGRPQMVRAGDCFILPDGTSDILDAELSSSLEGSSAVPLRNVGKKAAGRLLDGVTHDAMPKVAR